MPDVGAVLADRPDEVEAAAVGQPHVDHHTSGRSPASPCAAPRRCEPASPTTSKSSLRSNARRRPWRISSWSSTSSTVVGTGSSLRWSSLRTSDVGRPPPMTTSTTVPPSARGPTVSSAPMRVGALAHDLQAIAVRASRHAARCRRPRHAARRAGGAIRQVTQRFCAPGVLADVGDRLLGDPEQLGLGVDARSRLRRLVEHEVHRQVRGGADLSGRSRTGPRRGRMVGLHLAAQVEDRQPQLADDPGQLARGAPAAGSRWALVGRAVGQVVDDVAERGELLGDAVVDLPGQPAPLLGGGDRPHLGEQQRGLEPQRGLLDQLGALAQLAPVNGASVRSMPTSPIVRDADAQRQHGGVTRRRRP